MPVKRRNRVMFNTRKRKSYRYRHRMRRATKNIRKSKKRTSRIKKRTSKKKYLSGGSVPPTLEDVKRNCNGINDSDTLLIKLRQNFPAVFNSHEDKLAAKKDQYIYPYCNEDTMGPVDLVNDPVIDRRALHALMFNSNTEPNMIGAELVASEQKARFQPGMEGKIRSPKNSPEKFLELFLDAAREKLVTGRQVMTPLGTGIYTETDNEGNVIVTLDNRMILHAKPAEVTLILPNNTSVLQGKHQFIVSHGTFLKRLWNYTLKLLGAPREGYSFPMKVSKEDGTMNNIIEKPENLDIIQLILDEDGKPKGIIYRRWESNYSETKRYMPSMTTIDKDKDKDKNVFLMRHCFGCHNATEGIRNKLNQFYKENRKGDQKGYLQYAMCFDFTIDKLCEKKEYLKKLLDEHGGLPNYTFGSSVIFRAILTCILVRHVLNTDCTTNSTDHGKMSRRQVVPL